MPHSPPPHILICSQFFVLPSRKPVVRHSLVLFYPLARYPSLPCPLRWQLLFPRPCANALNKGNSHLILYDQFIAMLRWLNLSCKLPRFPEPYVIDWLVCLLCIPLFFANCFHNYSTHFTLYRYNCFCLSYFCSLIYQYFFFSILSLPLKLFLHLVKSAYQYWWYCIWKDV